MEFSKEAARPCIRWFLKRASGTGWWITPNGNPEACGGEEKTNRHILPDNSNVGMIVHKGCIRKGMLQVVLALAVFRV